MSTGISPETRITRLESASDDGAVQQLSDVLIDCVDGDASVSFMWPLSRGHALAFWRRMVASAAAGERILLLAHDEQGEVIGTVQVVLAQPDNQPHRAEIVKMLVHRRGRKQGWGAALMRAAEAAALEAGKTLLVLDTASADAERLYTRMGWQPAGHIPGYALLPRGGLCGTTFFYKAIGAGAR
ncbi:GNAT family N-acetyltransferase [Aquabacterium sp.]|uniref:GNAT family N-acetyltransferase n=1 Tax=Aquabacterium sp. TaxID=1872578 RepID=UPI002CC4F99C|nr:GNAT family N-acetyltransferase [Aquabacterium sp.]HSW04562.1 GNAT family N-acetyltransferase [Aquabacterium sp.]